jgi:hypothetical protein
MSKFKKYIKHRFNKFAETMPAEGLNLDTLESMFAQELRDELEHFIANDLAAEELLFERDEAGFNRS